MTDDEIREWVMEGAHIEFWDQGKRQMRIRDFDFGLKEFREREGES